MLESKDHKQVLRSSGALGLTFASRARGWVGSECQIRSTSLHRRGGRGDLRFLLRAVTIGRELPWTPSTFRGGLYFDRRLWVDLQPVRWADSRCREPQPPARTLCTRRSACGRISPPE